MLCLSLFITCTVRIKICCVLEVEVFGWGQSISLVYNAGLETQGTTLSFFWDSCYGKFSALSCRHSDTICRAKTSLGTRPPKRYQLSTIS